MYSARHFEYEEIATNVALSLDDGETEENAKRYTMDKYSLDDRQWRLVMRLVDSK